MIRINGHNTPRRNTGIRRLFDELAAYITEQFQQPEATA